MHIILISDMIYDIYIYHIYIISDMKKWSFDSFTEGYICESLYNTKQNT